MRDAIRYSALVDDEFVRGVVDGLHALPDAKFLFAFARQKIALAKIVSCGTVLHLVEANELSAQLRSGRFNPRSGFLCRGSSLFRGGHLRAERHVNPRTIFFGVGNVLGSGFLQ